MASRKTRVSHSKSSRAAADDLIFMQRALQLAEKGLGKTSPNPPVGAVIVRRGELIGEGYHRAAGKAHAEIEAIRDARRQGHGLVGSTLYVTLEPCCHVGRTPACTDAIIQERIARVVYAVTDPDQRIRGRGEQVLRKAGIVVERGLARRVAEEILAPYLHQKKFNQPYVITKLATSLDGAIATSSGESKWITGESARGQGRRLRALVDAVLIGQGTALRDDPALTTRIAKRRNPYRVVVMGQKVLPTTSQLLRNNADGKTILVVAKERIPLLQKKYRSLQVTLWPCRTLPDGRIDLQDLMDTCWREGLLTLLVEGGGRLIASFLEARLIQRWHQFVAPRLIGGGQPAVPAFGLRLLARSPRLSLTELRQHGDDFEFIGNVEYSA